MSSQSRFEFRVWGEKPDDVAARIATLSDIHKVRDGSRKYVFAVGVDDVNPEVPARAGDRAGDRW
jgi:hypothetical protein